MPPIEVEKPADAPAAPAAPAAVTAPDEEFKEETSHEVWDSLGKEFDTDEPDEPAAESPAKTVENEPPKGEDEAVEPKAPEAKPEDAPAKPEEKPAEPAPVEATAPAAPKAEEPPAAPAAPPISEAERQELRRQAVDQLAKSYEFDEETARELSISPEKVLPKLAAELQMRAYESVTNAVMRNIPALVTRIMQDTKTSAEMEEAFYAKWPQLKGYETQTLQMAQMWKQLNPNATPEKAAEEIGRATLAALGLAMTPISDQPPTEIHGAPAVFEAPPSPPIERQPTSARNENVFSALNAEFDAEEDFDN